MNLRITRVSGLRRCSALAAFVVGLTLDLGHVAAETKSEQAFITWSAEAGTDLPISIGVRATAKFDFGLRLSTGAGIFPTSYLELINAVVVPYTSEVGYSQDDADVVENALGNSLVLKFHAGWQFTRNLYAEVGYAFVGLGGGVSGEDVLVLVTDYPGGMSGQSGTNSRRMNGDMMMYELDSTLHMFDFELGWEWHIWNPIVIRTALGLAWTVGAETRISPQSTPRYPQFTEAFARYGEDYLNDLYTTYVISPTFSVGVGYEF